MTEFEAQVLADLQVLKSQVNQILGVGQPGRIVHLEERVEGHERGLQRLKGFVAASGILLTVAHIAIDYLCR
jgi:hypothetical protein